MPDMPPPTKPRVEPTFPLETLVECWYAHINKVTPGKGDTYRLNKVNFPKSRGDLIRYYEGELRKNPEWRP